MKYQQNKTMVSPWVSCHTYLWGSEESRSYISNERAHTYILLEGVASDMWKLLCDNVPEQELSSWAHERGLDGQVDSFLDELAAQGLLTDGDLASGADGAFYAQMQAEASAAEEAAFLEEMQEWVLRHNGLFSLFFELTYRCDLRCVHCYNPKDMAAIELDFDLCRQAIDDAYDMGCFRITFSGGEATRHSRFLELVAYARSKRISVEIFTNGQRLYEDKKLCRDLLALYPYRICVSLYSTEEAMHERVTSVKGSFQKTDVLIRSLREQNVNVQIKNFLLNFNCFDCINVKKMAQKIGATSLADISLIPTIEGDKKTLQFVLSEEELFRLYTDPESPLYVGDKFKPIDYASRMGSSPCSGGFSDLCVNPVGEVTICVSLPMTVGDLRKCSLREIWGKAMEKDQTSKLYQWQKLCLADYTQCFHEEYCAFCHFCPGMGYLENGYLKKSDILCLQAKVRMKAFQFLNRKKELESR